jgi:hypothetical protein
MQFKTKTFEDGNNKDVKNPPVSLQLEKLIKTGRMLTHFIKMKILNKLYK